MFIIIIIIIIIIGRARIFMASTEVLHFSQIWDSQYVKILPRKKQQVTV